MRVPRLYVDMPLVSGDIIELPLKQSNYLCKALRMEIGRELWLFNGQGVAFQAQIHSAHPKKAQVLVGEKDNIDRESPLKIELGIALSKGDRFDYVVQKATELGVTSICPLVTERIDVRLNEERMNKKLDHWRGIGISACEQSGRNILPVIAEPSTLDQWCDSLAQKYKLVLAPDAKSSIKDIDFGKGREVAVAIGPEGGFSSREIDLVHSQGFKGVALGPRILRTETAPLAIVSILQLLGGDF